MKVTYKAFQRARGKRDNEHSYSVNLNKFYKTQQYFITKIYHGPSIKYVQECCVVLKYLLLINNIVFPFHKQSEGFCLISEIFCFIHTLWTDFIIILSRRTATAVSHQIFPWSYKWVMVGLIIWIFIQNTFKD